MGLKSNFVLAKAGHLVPDDILERLIAAYPTSWAIAAVDPESKSVLIEKHLEAPVLADLKTNIEEFKDYDTLITVQAGDAASSEEDIQPFTVLKIGKDPSIAVAMVGAFPGYEKEKSVHGGDFFAAQELVQSIGALAQLAEDDLQKITNHIGAATYEKTLMNMATGPVVFCILSGTGETIIKQNAKDTFGKFPCGCLADNTCLKAAIAEAAETVAPTPGSSPFGRRKGGGTTPAAETKVLGDLAPATRQKPDTAIAAALTAATGGAKANDMVSPPEKELWEKEPETYKKVIKSYYKEYNVDGKTPSNYLQLPKHPLKPGSEKKWNEYNERIKAKKAGPAPKAEEPKATPEGVHTLKDGPVKLSIPKEQIDEFKGKMAPRIVDSGSSIMKDPKLFEEDEAKAPSFHEQTGVALAQILKYPRWGINEMAHKTPDLLTQAFIDLRRDNRAMAERLAKLEHPEQQGQEIPEHKPGEKAEPQKVATPSPAPAQPAASGSPFGRRKNAA